MNRYFNLDTGKEELTPNQKKCRQCIHFDLEKETYQIECFGCKTYYPDLFQPKEK